MTLILTQINRFGIIHASDSAITGSYEEMPDYSKGNSPKTFKIPRLKAGLTVAGSYSVGGVDMDNWMYDFIRRQYELKGLSIAIFAQNLRNELETKMFSEEKKNGCIIHLAGYVKENGLYHPEFWHVTNVSGVDQSTGKNTLPLTYFENAREEFWSACPKENYIEKIEKGDTITDINGLDEGRTSYNYLTFELEKYFLDVWEHKKYPDWLFRPPNTIKESKMYVELKLRTIITLFKASNYPVPYIGGPPQFYIIRQPKKHVREGPKETVNL